VNSGCRGGRDARIDQEHEFTAQPVPGRRQRDAFADHELGLDAAGLPLGTQGPEATAPLGSAQRGSRAVVVGERATTNAEVILEEAAQALFTAGLALEAVLARRG
jgi:hypothetical protein